MPYRYTTFNGINLPAVMPEDDLSAPPTPSTIVDSLSGGFNYLGNNRYYAKRHPILYKGIFVKQDAFWVDELGNQIVDEAGNPLVMYDVDAQLRSQVDDIKGQHGKWGQLIRRREDDSIEQFKMARLLDVKHIRTLRDADRIARLELAFEAEGRPWRRTVGSIAPGTLAANAVTALNVTTQGDEEIRDAIITITATNAITGLAIVRYTAAYNYYMVWSGSTIPAGQSLVIDCGAHTVKLAGANSYNYFSLYNGIHTGPDWLILEPTVTNQLLFGLTGGGAQVFVNFYDQWA